MYKVNTITLKRQPEYMQHSYLKFPIQLSFFHDYLHE